MGPADLQQILEQLPKISSPNVLVGWETSDDAGVFRLSDDLAIVQTLDFITPIVDDPYTFGAIAAANSVSDIYAMGGTPLTALNIVGYPVTQIDSSMVAQILQGSYSKLAEADVAVIGGHTIDNPSLIYGLSVTGTVHPQKIITNDNAMPGDLLVLTKPIGVGVITHGVKQDKTPPELVGKAVEVMTTLNKAAAEAMLEIGVNACTDVTGFGLVGHLVEMIRASQVGAKIFASKVPLLDGVLELIEQRVYPGGARSNKEAADPFTHWHEGVSKGMRIALCDPQTSGGLLISVERKKADALMEAMQRRGVKWASIIGEVISEPVGKVIVAP